MVGGVKREKNRNHLPMEPTFQCILPSGNKVNVQSSNIWSIIVNYLATKDLEIIFHFENHHY